MSKPSSSDRRGSVDSPSSRKECEELPTTTTTMMVGPMGAKVPAKSSNTLAVGVGDVGSSEGANNAANTHTIPSQSPLQIAGASSKGAENGEVKVSQTGRSATPPNEHGSAKNSSSKVNPSSHQGGPAPPTTKIGGSTTSTPNNMKTSMSPPVVRESSPSASEHSPSVRESSSPPKMEPKELKSGKKSKGAAAPSVKYEPPLYGHLPDATADATSTFEVIKQCIYSSKTIGDSGHDSETMVCECEPQFLDGVNHACDEDSDCINRLTLMECTDDGCVCNTECQNQRFQRRDYADISIFKTDKKGYGVRANSDIPNGRFVYEYVGEVIDEPRFRQRNTKYPAMGIKHFYFMSLEKDQFIDATIKGGLARFVNHSCNPNCETEKWVVGNKYRMGIFAKRDVKAGEELVFDYNVDRYGAEKQPCYCGEPICLGYIGGKTQTNSAPKLSGNLIEALGIDDDELPTKKSRRVRKPSEDEDEEYLAKASSRDLDFKSVATVMSTLSNTKEKWIVSKLVARIQRCDDEAVLGRVLQFHGYTIIGKFLTLYKDDEVIVLAILNIFISFPKLTRNKISAAGIEPLVEEFASSLNEEIKAKATELLAMWSALETSYRIPRRLAGEQPEQNSSVFLDRGRDSRSTSATESPKRLPENSSEPIPPWLQKNKHFKPNPNFTKQPPSGPRADRGFGGSRGHKNRNNKFAPRPPPFSGANSIPTPAGSKRTQSDLPWGWHRGYKYGECYYYANDGRVTWEIPKDPAITGYPMPATVPPPPAKQFVKLQQNDIQALILEAAAFADAKRKKEEEGEKEKQRQERRAKRKEKEAKQTYDVEKTRKYLAISFGKHVPNMVNKFNKDLGSNPKSAKENVKKYAKEIVELLVDKEIRYHKHVVDPLNVCDEAKVAKVKLFVDEYVRKLIERRKAARQQQQLQQGDGSKRKRDEPADTSAEDNTKRHKSLSPRKDAAPTTLVVPPSVASASPTRKRSHDEEDEGRNMPKRRKSLDAGAI